MLFNGRIIMTFNSFPSECGNFQVFTHSDFKITFSFAIIGTIAATTLKFVNNLRMSEQWNFVFKCKNVTNFALSLENKPDIAVPEFAFHYAINSCAYLKRQLTFWKLTFLLTFGSSPPFFSYGSFFS